ncbi:glycosyltransferase family 2 protein [Membranihabitans marinus]|uniref:glycosyltransferase family 2 protein n=1 Tax=Membranihabitans marinus TaxID=1227546 RepID=UPI001F25ED46|nr:glycosyltransferase family 2 protein [Membranihabitans marinus]
MDLSIIIISYNVKHYLSLCLQSVLAATEEIEAEIIVVDNDSVDDSVSYLRHHFPRVKVLANKENIGFGKACNQAIAIAQGKIILFVNPDTVVGEKTLTESLQYLYQTPKVGALGIRLIDGRGQILPESKRSIPSFSSSCYKFLGLSKIFPNVDFFNGYYAPNIGYYDVDEVEVLSGAYMMIRRDVLDKVGGFDPRFFMYAEDIDLSYRIRQSGYRLLYVGKLSAIHFKGESTQKSLLSYNDFFFTSMALFIKKYKGILYGSIESKILVLAVSIIKNVKAFFKWLFLPFAKPRVVKKVRLSHGVLMSNDIELRERLEGQLVEGSMPMVYEGNELRDGIPLRYIVEYLQLFPQSEVILDTKRMGFGNIVSLMETCPTAQYLLSDSERGFVLSSNMKNKQGDVLSF